MTRARTPDVFDFDDEQENPGSGEVTCNRCGLGPFTWLHTGVRWRLVDEKNKFHECHAVSKDDFDAVV